jgi:gas vesicle protein
MFGAVAGFVVALYFRPKVRTGCDVRRPPVDNRVG